MISNLGAYLTLATTKLTTVTNNNEIGDAVKTLLIDGDSSIYGTIKSVAWPIAVVVCAIAGPVWMFSPSGKGAETAKKFFIAAIIGLAVVYLALPAMNQVLNIVSSFS